MAQLHAQTMKEKVCFRTNMSIGMPLLDSDVKPLSLLFSAEYRLHPQFSVGLGTGLSKYDHLMIPTFAILHWQLTQRHRLAPFLACNIGHAFAPQRHVNGGFYLTPSVGVSYRMKERNQVSLSIGYELQEYEQLQSYESPALLTQYVEKISNHAITVNVGVTF